MNELIVFVAFGTLQLVFHNAHRVTGWAWIQKVSENHWIVWVFHPAIWHTVQDYGIHFVVYSGYVIRSH